MDNNDRMKIRAFTDLIVWQKSHSLVLEVYKLTKKFPRDELFALVSQIRRAVISITSNIAEAFGRFSEKEKLHFYYFAYGSLLEVLNQLMAARDLEYISKSEFDQAESKILEISKMFQSLMRKLRSSP